MRFDHVTTFRSSVRMTDSNMVSELQSPETLIMMIATHRDRQAYAALFTRFAPKVKAFVMGQGLTAQEAEDLAQDALLNVWRKAEMFDPAKATAATWIYSIARNLRIDLARKAKRVKALPEDLWLSETDKPADDMMVDAQSAKSITQIMNTLPEEQKAILRLSFYEDMSHGDIAKALSIPLGTVKSRMRLAMTRMRAGIGVRAEGDAI